MLANLNGLSKSLGRKGLILPNGPRPPKDDTEEEERQHRVATAYKDYKNYHDDDGEPDSDNESLGSNDSTKPSNESQGVKRGRPPKETKPDKADKTSFDPSRVKKYRISDGVGCVLCKRGFTLKSIRPLTENEQKWQISMSVQPRNASLKEFVENAHEFYVTKIRPEWKDKGQDFGDLTIDEIEHHIRNCTKAVSLERIIQIDIARDFYTTALEIAKHKLKKGVIDHHMSDTAMKYMEKTMKLLREKDREEKDENKSLTR
jgi:hypothetical protein